VTLFEDVPPLVRVRLLVAYDGSGFHGFAEQPGQRTVAGVLRAAIEKVAQHPVELVCAGRTDSGVHAWGQVLSLDLSPAVDLVALQRSLLKMCGPEVVVRECSVVDPDFHARFSATGRTYRYTVLNRPVPDPFLARTSWHVTVPLDMVLLELACDPFLGEHDFSAFCRRPKVAAGEKPACLVRRVRRAGWTELGDGVLRFEIEATAFCRQMVRSIVGTVVAAGHAQMRAGDIRGVLRAGHRVAGAPMAPPEGLCLWHVSYGGGPELRPEPGQP